jgi:hypothetical protein
MDNTIYHKYLNQYVNDAIKKSDGSVREIREELSNIQIIGRFTRNKAEKKRALMDAQVAFNEHRHWPLEIILSHLGIEIAQ